MLEVRGLRCVELLGGEVWQVCGRELVLADELWKRSLSVVAGSSAGLCTLVSSVVQRQCWTSRHLHHKTFDVDVLLVVDAAVDRWRVIK